MVGDRSEGTLPEALEAPRERSAHQASSLLRHSHAVPAQRAAYETVLDRGPWSAMNPHALLAAIGDGDVGALREMFRRHGHPAIHIALSALLDAGADQPKMLTFVRSAARPLPPAREQ
jgi:hypothetical protein